MRKNDLNGKMVDLETLYSVGGEIETQAVQRNCGYPIPEMFKDRLDIQEFFNLIDTLIFFEVFWKILPGIF